MSAIYFDIDKYFLKNQYGGYYIDYYIPSHMKIDQNKQRVREILNLEIIYEIF